METEKVRLRRTFAPLSVATSIICHTGSSSPFAQVYDAETASYEPDRGGTSSGVGSPCMIRPILELNADDGSIVNALGNSMLATSSMKWYVNGVDITTIAAWQDAYAISTAADYTRGMLTVYRNIPVGERCELTFEGIISDPRTNVNVPVTAGPIVLRTTDKSVDEWSVSICVDTALEYDPIRDHLLLYDFMVAHGHTTASDEAEQAADDATSYRLKVPVEVRRGATLQNSGYTLELYRVNMSTGALTQIALGTISTSGGTKRISEVNEITNMSLTEIDFDLRVIKKEEYQLVVKHGTKEVARGSFGIKRHSGDYILTPTNAAGVAPTDSKRIDVVQGFYEGNVLEHPACAICIIWKTKPVGGSTEKAHNEGERTEYNVGQAGLGLDHTTAELDQWLESEVKDRMAIATDENGKLFTDENDGIYIFN